VKKRIVIDEKLLEQAERLTGLKEPEALIREALTALIERERARRLARSDPDPVDVPRRRLEPEPRG
jgi:Arc/MetJ family transcription regulator